MFRPLLPSCCSCSIAQGNMVQISRNSKSTFPHQDFSCSVLSSLTNPAHSVGPTNRPFSRTLTPHCTDSLRALLRVWVTAQRFKGGAALLRFQPGRDSGDSRALMTGGRWPVIRTAVAQTPPRMAHQVLLRTLNCFFSLKPWSLTHPSKNQQPTLSGTSFCINYLWKKIMTHHEWKQRMEESLFGYSSGEAHNDEDSSTAGSCQSRKLAATWKQGKATNSQSPRLPAWRSHNLPKQKH